MHTPTSTLAAPRDARVRAPINPFKGEPIGATGLVVYLDVFGGWRWELHQGNGDVLDSPYCYDTRADCLGDAARRGLLPAAGKTDRRSAARKPSLRPVLSAMRAKEALPAGAPTSGAEHERPAGAL